MASGGPKPAPEAICLLCAPAIPCPSIPCLVASHPRDDPSAAPGTVAHAGVDPTLEGRALQEALRAAIATHRGCGSWHVDYAGWVVVLHSPVEQDFYRKIQEEGVAWCLGRPIVSVLALIRPSSNPERQRPRVTAQGQSFSHSDASGLAPEGL